MVQIIAPWSVATPHPPGIKILTSHFKDSFRPKRCKGTAAEICRECLHFIPSHFNRGLAPSPDTLIILYHVRNANNFRRDLLSRTSQDFRNVLQGLPPSPWYLANRGTKRRTIPALLFSPESGRYAAMREKPARRAPPLRCTNCS